MKMMNFVEFRFDRTEPDFLQNFTIEFLIQLLVLNVCFEYKIVHKLFERLEKVRGFT